VKQDSNTPAKVLALALLVVLIAALLLLLAFPVAAWLRRGSMRQQWLPRTRTQAPRSGIRSGATDRTASEAHASGCGSWLSIAGAVGAWVTPSR
jgi:hypothetical protein